ncbi:MAG: cupin domain-containing protein [Deltaproteobacteria bacterium]|nr:cupin domain-containing protein [Deltaproteobacteria bacterium]
MSADQPTQEFPPSEAKSLTELVEYGEAAVVSRTLRKSKAGTLTVFAFDAGQGLSEHSAPFDAYVQVLEGRTVLVIGGERVEAQAGELVLMPADIPHAVEAPERFKMLLTMVRDPA